MDNGEKWAMGTLGAILGGLFIILMGALASWTIDEPVAVQKPVVLVRPTTTEELLVSTVRDQRDYLKVIRPFAAALDRGEQIILLPIYAGSMPDGVRLCYVMVSGQWPTCDAAYGLNYRSLFGQILSAGIPLTLEIRSGVLTYETNVKQKLVLEPKEQ